MQATLQGLSRTLTLPFADNMKHCILTMDVEDWYHLDYFERQKCDSSVSMLDGIEFFLSFLQRHDLPSSFFVLGELAKGSARHQLSQIQEAGHEIASHGWSHQRPLTMTKKEFLEDLKRSKCEIEDVVGGPVEGYRAPCFSIDRACLDAVLATGHSYDSSRILFDAHPLYGSVDLKGFEQISSEIFRDGDFFEFQVSTLSLFGRNIPVSGGGYLRIFPWPLMKWLLSNYLRKHEFYVLYIHPFELSTKPIPTLPGDTRWMTRRRFKAGRKNVEAKLDKLVELLKGNGFSFTTFSALRNKLMKFNANPEG